MSQAELEVQRWLNALIESAQIVTLRSGHQQLTSLLLEARPESARLICAKTARGFFGSEHVTASSDSV
jgi:hypothetical protein